eukprot:gnl/TRDRNA2_/TRDRNA2_143410_c0_seq4.p1 gnl/TRDRNA2_/TRDRNA2_143410_c0~~gnl/TRDRNA2_/TRDRNA2_143410_c0_seq4.p1  ORF type:complete len:336 (+),score=30.31 gnl/TRDRNA2_/TRDRNA2_143410_c0_seq4:62-1069(+)
MPVDLNDVLENIDTFLEPILGHVGEHLYLDWKVWVGAALYFAVWAKWIIFGYDRRFYIKVTMVLGLNLIILSVMHHYDLDALAYVILIIILQNVGATYIWWKPSRVEEEGGFEISSIYEDFTMSIGQVIWIFVGQLLLVFFYFNAILNLGEINAATCSYVFWIAAFVSVQMSAMFNRGSESQLGAIWKPSLFHHLIANRKELEFQVPQFPTGMRKVEIVAWELYVRQVMGIVINQIVRDMIGYTTPLLLMQSERPLDFVMNSLAVTFIVLLDDTESKTCVTTRADGQSSSRGLLDDPEGTDTFTLRMSVYRDASLSSSIPGVMSTRLLNRTLVRV